MIVIRIVSLAIFLVSLASVTITHAQSENVITPSNKNSLHLHIHTLSFIKNNEYFNPIVQGHTLAGYHLHPFISYKTYDNITTKLGFFLRRNWGEAKLFSDMVPTFTLRYQQQNFSFLIGNIDGGTAHRLIQPLYDLERTLQGIPETGLQMRYITKSTFLDIWLDWLTLLDKKKDIPEELVAGISVEQRLAYISKIRIGIPLQIMLYHLGGQGITAKDFSLWIGSIGIRIHLKLGKQKLLKNIEFNNYYIANQYVKKVARPYKTGHAFFSQLSLNTNWFTLQGSYWNSYGFSSENLGHPLYQSISIINQQVIHQEKNRHLLLLHIGYKYPITKELKFILHVDPYYDINHHLVEHEAGFYVSYQPRFSLAN
jgi:hypothetical protein